MNPLTISALNTYIAALFERDEQLRDLWVTGEVSNWKRAASGHIYFSLKDNGAAINAVIWKGNAINQKWLPREGDQIVAHGYVSVYPERGVYQLYVNVIQPAGRGQLYEQLEMSKARLAAAGLFDPERKRPLPPLPKRIGIVTSPDAAALRDILRVLAARWPLVEVIVFPTLVQGADAPQQIVAALTTANQYDATAAPLDLLILTRGGGSIEDLWSFNHEQVAYAVSQSTVPMISGVGHETDVTLVDFVADLRAPTPTAAAVAATPDRQEVLTQLVAVQQQLHQSATDRLLGEHRQLQQLALRVQRSHPRRQLDLRRQRLDDREHRLRRVMEQLRTRLAERQQATTLRLEALNPRNVLRRGYSIVQKADGAVVTTPAQVQPGEQLQVQAAAGMYQVTAN